MLAAAPVHVPPLDHTSRSAWPDEMSFAQSVQALTAHDPLIERAYAFADRAHGAIDQRRKYTGDPYIVHPVRVATHVAGTQASQQAIAAALLHDVAEDVPLPVLLDVAAEHSVGLSILDNAFSDRDKRLTVLRLVFGKKIASFVEMVTDVSRPEDGNRRARKALDAAHLSNASPEAQTIKLADLLDNTESILRHDPDFAKVYMREKADLIPLLNKGDLGLREQAAAIIRSYEAHRNGNQPGTRQGF